MLIERNNHVGGAASTYKVGNLVVEASLHETSDPRDPIDPKHHVLARLGVLDKVEWVPTGAVYEVRGGPVGEPFVLPEGFTQARHAFGERFPSAKAAIGSVLGEMERIATGLGTLRQGGVFRNPAKGFAALARLGPLVKGWRLSLTERFDRAFGDDEAVKCALAANLAYYHDDPATLWWILFAVAQGGYLASGGRYIRGGSQRLSHALARTLKSAGGDVLLGRLVTKIAVDGEGRPSGVVHEHPEGGDWVAPRLDRRDDHLGKPAAGAAQLLPPPINLSGTKRQRAGRHWRRSHPAQTPQPRSPAFAPHSTIVAARGR